MFVVEPGFAFVVSRLCIVPVVYFLSCAVPVFCLVLYVKQSWTRLPTVLLHQSLR